MQLSCHLRQWFLDNADGFVLLVMLCAFPCYEVDSGPCCAPDRIGVLAMVNQRYPTHSPCICGCVCRTGMVRMPSFVGSWPLEDYWWDGLRLMQSRGACLGALLHVFWPGMPARVWVGWVTELKQWSNLSYKFSYFLFWHGLFGHVLIFIFFKSEIGYLLIVFNMNSRVTLDRRMFIKSNGANPSLF